MIQLSGIGLRFGERTLFRELSWMVPSGCRVGLVGDNGTGKTTLLRILVGDVQPDEGVVTIGKKLSVGYLPQDLMELPRLPVLQHLRKRAGIADAEEALERCSHDLASFPVDSPEQRQALSLHDELAKRFEALGGYAFDSMAKKVLHGLGFVDGDHSRNTSTFSGGWKMRIHLAGILLSAPDILLLDEPTNHLDTESMEWVEGWLLAFRGTIISVSHDRRFLDRICTSIAELSQGRIAEYRGNFSDFLVERENRLEELRKTEKFQKEEIAHLQEFIDRFRYKASKAASVQSRIKRLGKIDRVEIAADSKTVAFHFPPCSRSGLDVLTLKNVGKQYGDHTVLEDVSLTIQRGEKIAVVGVNGAGKSTLSRILGGVEAPSSGEVRLGYNVERAFYSQESAENLDYRRSVWETLSGRDASWTAQDKRNLLGAFLFSGDDIYKEVSVLSGGEKARLALLKLLLEKANFLILDEPTNHLDMKTKDLFQHALMEYDGTLVIVSHDRYFLDNLTTKVVEIAAGDLTEYPGNYSYFIEKRKERAGENADRQLPGRGRGESQRDQRRAQAERRTLLYRAKKKVLDRLVPLEERIEALEKEQLEQDALLGDPGFLSGSERISDLLVRRNATAQELASLLLLWEDLMSEMEAIENDELPNYRP